MFSFIVVCVWVATFVDLRVFWKPGSIFNVQLLCIVVVFKPNKYLLLLNPIRQSYSSCTFINQSMMN